MGGHETAARNIGRRHIGCEAWHDSERIQRSGPSDHASRDGVCISAASTPVAKPSMLLEALKEELFQLEVEKKQGKITPADYEKAKAALDQTLDRALKRQGAKRGALEATGRPRPSKPSDEGGLGSCRRQAVRAPEPKPRPCI